MLQYNKEDTTWLYLKEKDLAKANSLKEKKV
jgi:hypothetical protein